MSAERDGRGIGGFLGAVRRRWRLRRTLQGFTLAALAAVAAVVLAAALMSAWQFDPVVVNAARLAAYLAVGALALFYVLARLAQPMSNRAAAAYVEAREPGLDALMISAVDAQARLDGAGAGQPPPRDDFSPDLARRLVARAVATGRNSRNVGDGAASLRTLGWLLLALAVAGAGLWYGPPWLRHGVLLLVTPGAAEVAGNPYSLTVAPGDAGLGFGDDQLVFVTPQGFAPDTAELISRAGGETAWRREAMTRAEDGFQAVFYNLEQSREYYVQAGGVRSERFSIEVSERARMLGIELEYRYPAHTGLAPRRQVGGDIEAPRGTRVAVRVTAEGEVHGARLVFDSEQPVPLGAQGDALDAELDIRRSGRYRVEFDDERGAAYPASPEYAINALDDSPPVVAIQRPARDTRVSSLEEIEIAVAANDDLNVRELELVLSVNGAEEEVIGLPTGETARSLDVARVLYLEERALQPGDLIAYYARARDVRGDAAREAVTDIYFMEVRPFEREFRDAGSMRGGGGGGGGQGSEEQLAAQQRTLVVALFNLVRDRVRLGEEEYLERLGKIGAAQSRIRDRVDALVRRLQARSIIQLDPGFQQMARELPKAADKMRRVETEVAASKADTALPEARTALLHLQRAEAAFREVRLARSASGSGGSADANDLANLFRLEMDRFRNQYSDIRRGRQESDARDIDQTLQRLREIARRQQREIERARERAARGDGGAASQRALAEEAERMARRLERLSRRRPNPEFDATAERLRAAAQAMREAGSQQSGSDGSDGASASAGGADSNGGRGSVGASQAALDQLRAAERLLNETGQNRLARGVDDALDRARRLEQGQREVQRSLEGAGDAALSDAQRQALLDRKRQMLEDLRALEAQLDRLAGEAPRLASGGAARPEQPADAGTQPGGDGAGGDASVGRRLRAAGAALRDDDVTGKLEYSKRLLEGEATPAIGLEEQIARALQGARERIAQAAAALDAPGAGDPRRSLARLGDVVRSLDAQNERLNDRLGAGRGTAGDGDPSDAVRAIGADRVLRDTLRAGSEQLRGAYDALGENAVQAGDLSGVIGGLLQLAEESPGLSGARVLERQDELLARLKAIESQLRKQLNEQSPAVYAAREAPLPEDFKALAEAYFRQLSENETR